MPKPYRSRISCRSRITLLAVSCFLALGLPLAVHACIWDVDTLQMERQRFPSALELVTGKFLRHSEAYWKWRIEDREKKLAGYPSKPEGYDDLAVAYDKLGNHERAIELMEEKERSWPGLYETASNLGTFLVHRGDLEEGLVHLRRAVEINPDAHFGREIWQIRLVEYVIGRKKANLAGVIALPLQMGDQPSFDQFVRSELRERKIETGTSHDGDWRTDAVKGILGMMRFGNHRSPILLEALGDILRGMGYNEGQRLAARAYLRAAESTERDGHHAAAVEYRVLAKRAISNQLQKGWELELASVEKELAREIAEGDAFFAQIAANEAHWIEAGLDVDAKYAEAYYVEPATSTRFEWPLLTKTQAKLLGIAGAALLAALLVVLVRRHRATKEKAGSG